MKNLQNTKMSTMILFVILLMTQSCQMLAQDPDNVNPRVTTQKMKYVIFNTKPSDENLSGPKGAYQDLDGDKLADVRYGHLPRPFTANKGDYQIDKILFKPEIVLWDGDRNHPYEKTGQTTCVAFGPGMSKVQVGVPIPVSEGNVLFSISKDGYDRLNSNTAGWSTYLEADL